MSNTQPIEAIEAEGAIQALHIPVALIDRDPAQPRTHFDEAALADLAESIRAHGVIQPIEVEATGDGRPRLRHLHQPPVARPGAGQLHRGDGVDRPSPY